MPLRLTALQGRALKALSPASASGFESRQAVRQPQNIQSRSQTNSDPYAFVFFVCKTCYQILQNCTMPLRLTALHGRALKALPLGMEMQQAEAVVWRQKSE